ncbi:hypothetical protein ElyMa_007075000 [Elysia marginata]|uniref:Cysteine-rich transmembrane CYSTM domain-containing protein n=1 Tax=Elysia marginata TaxID=1093978 RepID=A0AAV4K1H5_9GAST|nr:hypothetical protein ElyMa_007075000 [Elysia marginata]
MGSVRTPPLGLMSSRKHRSATRPDDSRQQVSATKSRPDWLASRVQTAPGADVIAATCCCCCCCCYRCYCFAPAQTSSDLGG